MTASHQPPDPVLPSNPSPIALSFDLDDTLWPIWPTIERAEEAVHGWLRTHAPATAERFDRAALRGLRNEVAAQNPAWRHDLSTMRRESLREALRRAGDDTALAEPAFDVFFEARQRVELYPDALDAMHRMARRFRLIALTNGNSDLSRVGIGGLFTDTVSASTFGIGKPDPRIFHAACRRLGHAPAEVLHIGDDLMLDVKGALDAGMPAVWLRRDLPVADPVPPLTAPYRVFADLATLADALGC